MRVTVTRREAPLLHHINRPGHRWAHTHDGDRYEQFSLNLRQVKTA